VFTLNKISWKTKKKKKVITARVAKIAIVPIVYL
jgi:hypothetical protein